MFSLNILYNAIRVLSTRIARFLEKTSEKSFTIVGRGDFMSFGDTLRSLLEERNLTQKELATQLNMAPSTLSSYVQNVREPDFDTLRLLASYFSVSTDYLLEVPARNIRTPQESEMLRIFRSLSVEQQEICIEQCRVFVKCNQNSKKGKWEKSS